MNSISSFFVTWARKRRKKISTSLFKVELLSIFDYIEMDEDTLHYDDDYYKTNTNANMKFAINAIRIADEKEGWGNGRSDISWVGRVYSATITNGQRLHEDFKKVKGSQINSWLPLGDRTSYFSDEFNNKYDPSVSNGAFIMYERDVRVKFERTFTPVYFSPLSGSNSQSVTYISKESPYGEVYLPSSYFYYTESYHGKYTYLNGAQITVIWKYVP